MAVATVCKIYNNSLTPLGATPTYLSLDSREVPKYRPETLHLHIFRGSGDVPESCDFEGLVPQIESLVPEQVCPLPELGLGPDVESSRHQDRGDLRGERNRCDFKPGHVLVVAGFLSAVSPDEDHVDYAFPQIEQVFLEESVVVENDEFGSGVDHSVSIAEAQQPRDLQTIGHQEYVHLASFVLCSRQRRLRGLVRREQIFVLVHVYHDKRHVEAEPAVPRAAVDPVVDVVAQQHHTLVREQILHHYFLQKQTEVVLVLRLVVHQNRFDPATLDCFKRFDKPDRTLFAPSKQRSRATP
jgi:hypothetical protein